MNVKLHIALGLLIAAHGLVQAQTIVLMQRFDSVTAPNLPAEWVNTASDTPGWSTTTAAFDTAPNSAFVSDPDFTSSDSSLTSPAVAIATTNAQLTFRHLYDTERNYDGGVLEISINSGAFNDILGAGGRFISGGYNGILGGTDNPIEGRSAWTGNSGTFVTTVVNLPAIAAGQAVRLRWRFGSDDSLGETGWYVDTISVTDGDASLVAPRIVDPRHVTGNIVFSFDTVPGQTYITEFKNFLSTNALWVPLLTNAGDGTRKSVTNSMTAGSQRYFRVLTQ
jgi:hypothetical protein